MIVGMPCLPSNLKCLPIFELNFKSREWNSLKTSNSIIEKIIQKAQNRGLAITI